MDSSPRDIERSTQRSLSRTPIQLEHGDHRQVVVSPADLDRFVLSATEAVTACANQQMAESFQKQMAEKFGQMTDRIIEWCEEHDTVVGAAYMHSDGGMACEVATRGSDRLLELDEDLNALELEVMERYPEFRLTIRSVPGGDGFPWEPDRCAREVMVIYAETGFTPQSGQGVSASVRRTA